MFKWTIGVGEAVPVHSANDKFVHGGGPRFRHSHFTSIPTLIFC
jgi:hypothetical protein